ncbi:MAG: sugar phosphate nucleotidyltransferase [Candidatus Eisenbacteria bacterium]
MKDVSLEPIRTVAMILAGGRVGELSVLTMERPKAALPFAGYYRIIDFALSNLMLAGVTRVGILSQYRPASLIEHVGTGESWDFVGLDRGAKILPPFWGGDAGDWYQGNADAVHQNWNYVEDYGADLLLVVSGDHIYSLDYQDIIRFHLEREADLTIGFKKMPHDPHFGYGRLDETGRVLEYGEKSNEPVSDHASLTIYVIDVKALREVFESEDGRLGKFLEFGRHVIPYMLEKYRVFGYDFDGYWAYTRTIPMYYQAHQDLISGKIDIDAWGIRTNLQDTLVADQPPARFGANAVVSDSLISTGCQIDGEVIRSVLSPGVRVERGARVIDSILCHNTVVGAGSVVARTISDKHVILGADCTCGGDAPGAASEGQPLHPHGWITVLGKKCEIGDRTVLSPGTSIIPEQKVPAGARVERRS